MVSVLKRNCHFCPLRLASFDKRIFFVDFYFGLHEILDIVEYIFLK
jgi:hypothetical protein